WRRAARAPDTAGSVTPSARAAALTDPSRATSTNASSCVSVTLRSVVPVKRSLEGPWTPVPGGRTLGSGSRGRGPRQEGPDADAGAVRVRAGGQRRRRARAARAPRTRGPAHRRRPQPAADDEAAARPAR